jgi:hypothetical protein
MSVLSDRAGLSSSGGTSRAVVQKQQANPAPRCTVQTGMSPLLAERLANAFDLWNFDLLLLSVIGTALVVGTLFILVYSYLFRYVPENNEIRRL